MRVTPGLLTRETDGMLQVCGTAMLDGLLFLRKKLVVPSVGTASTSKTWNLLTSC